MIMKKCLCLCKLGLGFILTRIWNNKCGLTLSVLDEAIKLESEVKKMSLIFVQAGELFLKEKRT
jgi:hypothetical protein